MHLMYINKEIEVKIPLFEVCCYENGSCCTIFSINKENNKGTTFWNVSLSKFIKYFI